MSLADDYEIKTITSQQANAMVVKNHYLHRKASAMYTFGLFNKDEMVGTIIYGKPASPSLCKGLFGPEESKHVIELTRLWIKDGTPKNTESFLIGSTLKLIPKEHDIIVSYAEIDAGHVGVVYQATNWIYTGKSSKHVQWAIAGLEGKHSRHLFDEHGGIKGAKLFYGDQMVRQERPRKHRYVYLTGSKTRKRELMKKLRYDVLPYPKGLAHDNA